MNQAIANGPSFVHLESMKDANADIASSWLGCSKSSRSRSDKSPPTSNSGSAFLSEVILRILPAFIILILSLRVVVYDDLGWQLKLGEIIYQQASAIVPEPFAASHLGEPIIPNSWLGQLIFAQVRDWLGIYGLRAIDASLWMGGLLAAAIPARRRSERPLAIVFALIVGFTVALSSASIRPQSFAALAFGLTLAVIQLVKSTPMAVLICLPIFILWQNLHPSVPVAVLIIGALAAIRWAMHAFGKAERPSMLTALTLTASASVFATPAGWHIVGFARSNEDLSRLMGATEWFPLWAPFNHEWILPISFASALAVAVIISSRSKVRLEEIVPALVSLILTVYAVRFILFFGIALVPLLTRAKIGQYLSARPRSLKLISILTGLGIAAEFLFIPVRFQPSTPLMAVEKLKSADIKGTIYCDPAFGGLLVDVGYPDWKVGLDSRWYRYTRREWQLFKRSMSGPVRLSEFENRYHPAAYVLSPVNSPSLIGALRAEPANWRELFEDRHSIVFVRSSGIAGAQSVYDTKITR